MSNSETTLQAIKLKGYIGPDQKLEITEHPSNLPEGDVKERKFQKPITLTS